jgi:putative DNA methylase
LLGVTEWGQLFAPRQALAILTLIDCLAEVESHLKHDQAFSKAILTCLALAIDRQADYDSSLCRWVAKGEFIGSTFARQALGIIWDFAEVNPMSGATGDFGGAVQWVAKVCASISLAQLDPGHAERASATRHPLPNDSANLLCTDPPYYDAVPYADLSDFFYVWLKRSIGRLHPELFSEGLTPKDEEVVQLAERNQIYAFKTKERFESLMRAALQEGRRFTVESGLAVVVFAHKSTTAWETMLQAVIDSGWVATASWPIDTERSSRLRSLDSAALASSVHLVCRPRENHWDSSGDSDIGDWRDVLAELPRRIHDWMPRLQAEGVVGADAIFACLGPALEIFSRYSRVEKPNGEQVPLREYLEYVWAAVSKEAISMIFEGADTTGFEEDARLTAMWLWTLSAGPSNVEDTEAGGSEDSEEEADEKPTKIARLKGFSLEYDAARKIAQGLGAHLEHLVSLVEVKGETARLLPVAERTKALFGKEGTETPAARRKKSAQLSLPGVLGELEQEGSGWTLQNAAKPGTTTLDRLHQAMILFAAGRGEGLRRFLVDDGVGKDQRFWGLAQSLCALYPSGTDERRWSEGVLARKKGLGL